MNGEQNQVLRIWEGSAPYWEKHRAIIEKMFAPLTSALVDEAHIGPGQKVLDVAGGTGEPSLTIARVVEPGGSVMYTDLVAGMVHAAEQEAQRRGLANIQFRQCPADSLPFPDNAFDVAVSRLGAMFFPDAVAAVCEMLRLVVPGAYVSLAVWAARDVNPFFRVVTDVMDRYVESPPEDPDAPGAFRFAPTGKLATVLERAGATQIRERTVKFSIQVPVPLEQFWTLRVEMSDTLREKVARLTSEHLPAVKGEVEQAAREFVVRGTLGFPAQALIVSGRKLSSAG